MDLVIKISRQYDPVGTDMRANAAMASPSRNPACQMQRTMRLTRERAPLPNKSVGAAFPTIVAVAADRPAHTTADWIGIDRVVGTRLNGSTPELTEGQPAFANETPADRP